jgi:hypothetical protein
MIENTANRGTARAEPKQGMARPDRAGPLQNTGPSPALVFGPPWGGPSLALVVGPP